jgi:aldose 1-epimerase
VPFSAKSETVPADRGFLAIEPMVGITNAMNAAQKGTYKELQTVAPGGSWQESFWISTTGY